LPAAATSAANAAGAHRRAGCGGEHEQHAAGERDRPAGAGVRRRENSPHRRARLHDWHAAHRCRLQPQQHKIREREHERAARTDAPRARPAEARRRDRGKGLLVRKPSVHQHGAERRGESDVAERGKGNLREPERVVVHGRSPVVGRACWMGDCDTDIIGRQEKNGRQE
jgi:hypothetical protein